MLSKTRRFKISLQAYKDDNMALFGRTVRMFMPRTLLEFVVYMYDNGINPRDTVNAVNEIYKHIGSRR